MMEQDKVLSMVRGLVEKAEHPETPESEAKACREKADALMLKYAIDQAMLRDSQPIHERQKPTKMRVNLMAVGSPFETYIVDLAYSIARYARCQMVLHGVEGYIRDATVYGFEADIRYFELLWTTLNLHLANGLDPSIDLNASLEDNVYMLHNAGLNWLEIAKLYGWVRIGKAERADLNPWLGQNDERKTETQVGSFYKRAYQRACTAKGVKPLKLAASRTAGARLNYKQNFAKFYAERVELRLLQAQMHRAGGSEIILHSSMQEVRDLLNADCPNLGSYNATDTSVYDEDAARMGAAHGAVADIGGHGVGRGTAGALS